MASPQPVFQLSVAVINSALKLSQVISVDMAMDEAEGSLVQYPVTCGLHSRSTRFLAASTKVIGLKDQLLDQPAILVSPSLAESL